MEHINEKEELKGIIRAFEKDYYTYKASSSQFNEQMTRQQYIDRLLRLLGWDISNPDNLSFNSREIVAEEFSNSSDRPDYTIRMNGSSLFYVEAKKVNIDIKSDRKSALQARRYGWNSGHKISVLTNFEYLSIYTTFNQPNDIDGVATNRYKLYHYTEFLDKFDEIYLLLSKQSVLNGYFDTWTSQIAPKDATKLSLDQVFLDQLNEWRLLIAKDLIDSAHESFENLTILNESIQSFLNQLIFLRFIEDNSYEQDENLRHSVHEESDYQTYFGTLDKKYNAGIFENPEVILNIKKETLAYLVEHLYFPNVSYDFSVIDLSILSRIYENFLQQEIVLDENNQLKLEKTKSAKIKAVVSTPDEVVKLMVKKTLGKVLKDRSPEEILELKIGDLAVGSGIFLIEAYNFIENHLVDYYSQLRKVNPTPYLVPFDIKKKIIKNVFRGFDINNQAVQLTRFSLLLRLLSYEKRERIEELTPLLPSLEDTIICGNSLVDERDIDFTLLSYDDSSEIIPMPNEVFDKLKFDVILGNPPYLKTNEVIASTSKIEIAVYQEKYDSYYMQYDKYFFFVERVISLLKYEGLAALLIPNKLFTINASKKLRKKIVATNGLSAIVDFKSTQIFKDVINYVAIVELGEFGQASFDYLTVDSVDNAFVKQSGLKYDITELDSNPWFLTENGNLLNKYKFAMANFPSIEEAITPVNGIQTSANAVFVIPKKFETSQSETLINFEVKKKNKTEIFSIEKAILRDFYQPAGSEQGRSYQNIEAQKFVVFPYIDGKIINQSTMEVRYPCAWEYLKGHKEQLLPKSMGGTRDVQYLSEWYQYGRTQFLKESNEDRIIVGVLSNQPNFNIDRSGMMFASGGTAGYIALVKKDVSPYALEYIQAWLSHPFTDLIFQTIGSSFEGDFYTHGTGLYSEVPLLPIDFTKTKEEVAYEAIVQSVREIELTNSQFTDSMHKAEVNFLKKRKQAYIEKINHIFDELLQSKVENVSSE